jgi:hypothetical protein
LDRLEKIVGLYFIADEGETAFEWRDTGYTVLYHCTALYRILYSYVQGTGYRIFRSIPYYPTYPPNKCSSRKYSTVEVYDGFCIHVGGSTYSTVQYSTVLDDDTDELHDDE